MFNGGTMEHHPTSPPMKPHFKTMSAAAWSGVTKLYRNEFINWQPRGSAGGNQYVICLNPFGSDYIQPQHFYDTKFTNVDPEAMTWLMSPSPGWANPTDCVEFPCTAPYNVLFSFFRT